jgi:hypothetical protein
VTRGADDAGRSAAVQRGIGSLQGDANMDNTIKLRFGYIEGYEDVDVMFFRELPETNLNAPVRHTEKGIELAKPDISVGDVIISGTATATVTALASLIKAWLRYRRTKIELRNNHTGVSITYEGPSLNKETGEISSELVRLIDAEQNMISIHATRQEVKELPDAEP